MSGFYPVDHGDMTHPVFGVGGRQPFTRWEAYCWLLDHAAIGHTDEVFRGKPVTLDRGQVATSIGELARTWKWTKPSVQRFINGLISAGFIAYSPAIVSGLQAGTVGGTAGDTGVTMITLCKYAAIQPKKSLHDTDTDTSPVTPPESTQYRVSYVNKKEEGKKRRVRGTSLPAAPPPTATPRQGDLLPTAEVVAMPTDDVQTAFAAYRVVAKELGLAVPMPRLDGKRRAMLRKRLSELGGLDGWAMALEALRNATFITSGRWKSFSVDDMVTPEKLEKLLAGGYSEIWGNEKQHPVLRQVNDYYRDHHEESFFHGVSKTGTVRQT
jgi:hypothetical protein